MKYQYITILLVIAAMVLAMAGCSADAHRKECASQRWERKINQARMDAAEESIAKGELAFAELILQDCANSKVNGQQAQQMLAEVQTAQALNQQIAKARQQQNLEDQVH